MRLHLILPGVEPRVIGLPTTCPYERCMGTRCRHHQEVSTPLRDTVYAQVVGHRSECL
jgi:hypothetical protein